jgi:hypothetical protein
LISAYFIQPAFASFAVNRQPVKDAAEVLERSVVVVVAVHAFLVRRLP